MSCSKKLNTSKLLINKNILFKKVLLFLTKLIQYLLKLKKEYI